MQNADTRKAFKSDVPRTHVREKEERKSRGRGRRRYGEELEEDTPRQLDKSILWEGLRLRHS